MEEALNLSSDRLLDDDDEDDDGDDDDDDGDEDPVPVVQEAEWASRTVRTARKISSAPRFFSRK